MKREVRTELANYLLNHCFLVGTLDVTKEKYYTLLANLEEMQQLFEPLGYTIQVNRTLRVAQLVNQFGAGRVEFLKYESILLLLFRLLYVEKRETLSVQEQIVTITVEELETEYNKLNLPRKLDRRMLEDSLRKFRRYHLAMALERLDSATGRIQIFPSIILLMPEEKIEKACQETRERLSQYERSEWEGEENFD